MKNYKQIVFKKLAQQNQIMTERDVKIGDIFKWDTKSISYLNKGDLFEITSIDKTQGNYFRFNCKILTGISAGAFTTWRLDRAIMDKDIVLYKSVEPEKPHEYSPVQMTGRYKTIGD